MKHWIWLPLLFVLSMAGCSGTPTDKEKNTVSELTTNMRTWGLGRFLVDIPSSWRYGDSETLTLYYGLGRDFEDVEITVIESGVSPEQFQETLNDRINIIKNEINYAGYPPNPPKSYLVKREKLSKEATRELLTIGTEVDTTYKHELHALIDDIYVLFQSTSYDDTSTANETRLKTLASQIIKVTDPVHAGPGFIFGPIIIRGDHDHESAVIEFYDPERLDMTFEAHVSAMTPDDDTPLFQRADQGLPILQRLGIGVSTLRRDTREIGGMEAQEQLLATVSERLSGHPIRALSFAAETYRDTPALARPTLFLKMEAGGDRKWKSPEEIQTRTMLGAWTLPSFVTLPESSSSGEPRPPVTSSLSDYEAMAVWDAILKSIRPRPGAVSPPKPKSEAIPVGPNPDQLNADRRTLDSFIAEGRPPTPPKD